MTGVEEEWETSTLYDSEGFPRSTEVVMPPLPAALRRELEAEERSWVDVAESERGFTRPAGHRVRVPAVGSGEDYVCDRCGAVAADVTVLAEFECPGR